MRQCWVWYCVWHVVYVIVHISITVITCVDMFIRIFRNKISFIELISYYIILGPLLVSHPLIHTSILTSIHTPPPMIIPCISMSSRSTLSSLRRSLVRSLPYTTELSTPLNIRQHCADNGTTIAIESLPEHSWRPPASNMGRPFCVKT